MNDSRIYVYSETCIYIHVYTGMCWMTLSDSHLLEGLCFPRPERRKQFLLLRMQISSHYDETLFTLGRPVEPLNYKW